MDKEKLICIIKKETTVFLLDKEKKLIHKIILENDDDTYEGEYHLCITSYAGGMYVDYHADYEIQELDKYKHDLLSASAEYVDSWKAFDLLEQLY